MGSQVNIFCGVSRRYSFQFKRLLGALVFWDITHTVPDIPRIFYESSKTYGHIRNIMSIFQSYYYSFRNMFVISTENITRICAVNYHEYSILSSNNLKLFFKYSEKIHTKVFITWDFGPFFVIILFGIFLNKLYFDDHTLSSLVTSYSDRGWNGAFLKCQEKDRSSTRPRPYYNALTDPNILGTGVAAFATGSILKRPTKFNKPCLWNATP